ncbi:hypothetical protein BDF14DRAFT_913221 [Spinellus fusiger]|nr:hypothetical protein BDF14DRAFT_913221 [Spinellus fusiger]
MSTPSEIRRLFKQQTAERTKKNVTHPFAKYDTQGKLVCVVCNVAVKTETLWPAHLSSASHKETIAKLKAIKERQQQLQQKQAERVIKGELKRTEVERAEEEEESTAKRPRYTEEEEEEEEMPTALPADFFDAPTSASTTSHTNLTNETQDLSFLPAGFFDDAEQEARARKAPPPKVQLEAEFEKEYELFREVMVEPTAEADKIREEDEEAFWIDRDEELLKQQIDFDTRVEALKQLRQEGKVPTREHSRETAARMEWEDTERDIRLGLKKGVRDLLKKTPKKTAHTVFEDMETDESDDSDSEEKEEKEWGWRVQQL